MTEQTRNTQKDTACIKSKPRLVLMGEFSAGKSTLSNILLNSASLPMRVTATRLPPVQISYGEPQAVAVGLDASRTEIDLAQIVDVKLEDTLLIEISMQEDVLQLCDIIDMPGISDPNMPQEIWEGVIEKRDHVIWCTHATQAWRQSEAAIWNTLRDETSGHNILLITQFDKLRNDRDKSRVLRRVEHETRGLFEAVYPVCLLDALNAGDDVSIWETSGAAAFSEHVIQLLVDCDDKLGVTPYGSAKIVRNDLRDTSELRHHAALQAATDPVMPRRVRPTSGAHSSERAPAQTPVQAPDNQFSLRSASGK